MRWKWTPGSIAFWDNRVVVHKAVPGGYDPTTREGKRIAVFGERPFFDPAISETLSERKARLKKESALESAASDPKTNGNDVHVNGGFEKESVFESASDPKTNGSHGVEVNGGVEKRTAF